MPCLLRALYALAVTALASLPAHAEDLVLTGAGSLKEVMTEIVRPFGEAKGISVKTAFEPSGLMRESIGKGEAVHVFASADMGIIIPWSGVQIPPLLPIRP